MLLVDGHEDIASNVLFHGRDVRRSVTETRARETAARAVSGVQPAFDAGTAMLGLPEHRRGGVGLVFATIFVAPGEREAMAAKGLAQLRYYHDLARQPEAGVRLITTRDELATLERDFAAASTPERRPVGFVLLMEGADPLRDPAELARWSGEGLRLLGLSWHATRYAGGTGAPGPLTDLGRALLGEMQRLGVALDISHLAEESFWQALDHFSGTVIASHSNCRAYVPTDRQLSDEMIQAIAARDGVMGTVLANPFLVDGWTREATASVTLDAVVRHIDHICQLTGSAAHSAIGSDFDGGFGVETTPLELDSVADLGAIGAALTARGYRAEDVASILGGNWLRILRRALPA
ncbi:MAG: membrane dipeptidase [Ktedonobacterales bacterium]|nr:membrane dipeptidase [Ktedonobacterales bacterium]